VVEQAKGISIFMTVCLLNRYIVVAHLSGQSTSRVYLLKQYAIYRSGEVCACRLVRGEEPATAFVIQSLVL